MHRLTNKSMYLMNKLKSVLAIAAIVASTLPLAAQQKRVSPHDTVSAVIDSCRVTVTYGRPYTKDPKTGEPRKIWGGLVPYGKVWRLGADEATTLITQKPLVFGATTVPAGAYSLYLLPQADGSAKLIINKELGQWGMHYDDQQDLTRIDLKKEPAEKPLDQLAIIVAKTGGLKIAWDDTQYSATFTVQK